MVIVCSAPGCSVKKDSANSKTNVLFHRFPLRKPDVLAKWVKAMKNPNFKPTVKSYLCSAHFLSADYEIRPNNGGKHLKTNAVPSVFEKRRPGRKKKLLSENEVAEGTKQILEVSIEKNEADDIVEEEYLEVNPSDKEEPNLAEIIGNQEKETLQILIVDENGKITNSEYIFKKELFSDEESKPEVTGEERKNRESDDESGSHLKQQIEQKYWDDKMLESGDCSLLNYNDSKSQEKKNLEAALLSARKKMKDLQFKCKKMNKKLNRLKILLKLLVLKRGKGEKNLKQLFAEYEKDLEDFKVKKENETSDF